MKQFLTALLIVGLPIQGFAYAPSPEIEATNQATADLVESYVQHLRTIGLAIEKLGGTEALETNLTQILDQAQARGLLTAVILQAAKGDSPIQIQLFPRQEAARLGWWWAGLKRETGYRVHWWGVGVACGVGLTLAVQHYCM